VDVRRRFSHVARSGEFEEIERDPVHGFFVSGEEGGRERRAGEGEGEEETRSEIKVESFFGATTTRRLSFPSFSLISDEL